MITAINISFLMTDATVLKELMTILNLILLNSRQALRRWQIRYMLLVLSSVCITI